MYTRLNRLLSSIIGQHCILCGQTAKGDNPHSDFCPACLNDLPTIIRACQQCGALLESECAIRCGACATSPPYYDRVISAYAYARPIKQLIAQFKFQQQLSLAPIFAHGLLTKIGRQPSNIEALLPVPLHPARLRQRGFNQAIELARPLAHAYKKPILVKPVTRIRDTDTQSSLPAKQRVKNMHDAFTCTRPLKYKAVAIVDDVMTTGSTVNALAKVLKEKGVEYIEVWCIARANV